MADFLGYKACVPLTADSMLCFNGKTKEMKIVYLREEDVDLETVSKNSLMALKAKLDAIDKVKKRK